MTTGQAPIKFKEQSNLDLQGDANIALNQAELAAKSSVDGQDTYPLSVTTNHLFANDGIFYGALKAGTIFVGSGGVIISSEADGATPSTGVLISSSQIQLLKSGVATITLDGTDGNFTIQSAASGARIVLDETGFEAYNSGGAKTIDIGSDGTFTIQTAASGARVVLNANGVLGYNSGGTEVFHLDSSSGAIESTSFTLKTAASGTRTQIDNASGIVCYDSSDNQIVTIRENIGIAIQAGDSEPPAEVERLRFGSWSGASFTERCWLGSGTTYGFQIYHTHADSSGVNAFIRFVPQAIA